MSTRTFVIGLVVFALLLVAGGFGLAALSHGHSRPEGVAERWLNDVGDTTRKGIEADATRRAEKIGPLELADQRLVDDHTGGKAAFPDLEVGKAVEAGALAADPAEVRVAFRVHTRRSSGTFVGNNFTVTKRTVVAVNGAITLAKTAGKWMVTDLEIVGDTNTQGGPRSILDGLPKLPSDGGPPPSAAPNSLWLGALVGAAIVGLLTTALVDLAGRGRTIAAAGAV